jgi:hypothetical protein
MVFIISYEPGAGQVLNGVKDCLAPEIHWGEPVGGVVDR